MIERNSIIQRYRTFSELLAELKARLGFVSQGPSSMKNNALLESILKEAHTYVYNQLNPNPMRKKTVITLEKGSYLYDWHNDIEDEDIDPGLANSLWIVEADDTRYKLVQGITEYHREDNTRSRPTRYDTLNGQIELWPIPDISYGLLIDYIASEPRFFKGSDRPGVPDTLVILYAAYVAKAHYRMPDYQIALNSFMSLLNREKTKQHENKRYFVNDGKTLEGEVVVSGDGKHRFVFR